jgi:hypothetical protein
MVVVDVDATGAGPISGMGVVGGYAVYPVFTVYNIEAAQDTLEFSGTIDDSSMVTLTPVFRGGTPVLYHMDNYFDFTLDLLKDVGINANPIAGQLNALVEMSQLNSLNEEDVARTLFLETIVYFDGSVTPRMLVTEEVDRATAPKFWYRVNLVTGAITRDAAP